MSKYIVITSIFNPTEAIEKFSKVEGYQLVVVGDKKTPADWKYPNVVYLSVEDQLALGYGLSSTLPFNHYCRKMVGYLYALQNGATEVVDTDDDNIPYEDWTFPAFEGNYRTISEDKGDINIYELYTDHKIWPRGYPLRLISKKESIRKNLIKEQNIKVGIWQGLADEDPDVDAIYRLTSDELCNFERNGEYVLDKDVVTPFNSQNTVFCKELLALLYLPSYVTFRFTDILRGLVAQPILWHYGYRLGFTNPTVVQKRNPHDYMKDFESEIPMYLHGEKVVGIVGAALRDGLAVEDNLLEAYKALRQHDIVTDQEIATLEAWVADFKKLS